MEYVTNVFVIGKDLRASAGCLVTMWKLICKEYVSLCSKERVRQSYGEQLQGMVLQMLGN
jgi:hypothetical protein